MKIAAIQRKGNEHIKYVCTFGPIMITIKIAVFKKRNSTKVLNTSKKLARLRKTDLILIEKELLK